jgi:hypothetical protein
VTRAIDAYGARATIRRPLGTVGLTVITLGIYGVVWYRRVNEELRSYGRAYRDDALAASNPERSALALVPGFLLGLIPPLVSAYGFAGRVRKAERYGQSELTSGWLVATMIVSIIFIPAIPGYVQSSLNELWKRYPDADPAEEAADAPAPEPGALRRFWAWIVGPPREPAPPPEWVLQPGVGALAFVVAYALFQDVSPVLGLAPQIYLAVQAYEDRRALGLPHFWWSSAIGSIPIFGPIVFLMYVQNRKESLANMGGGVPDHPGDDAASGPPAAWYPDPWGRARLRWWDGDAWTGDITP